MGYLIITPRNLEDAAVKELSSKGFKVAKSSYRKLTVEYKGDPKALLELRAPDDVLVFLTYFRDEYHYIGQLGNICDRIKEININEAIMCVKKIRELPEKMTFSVTASIIGKRKFTQDYLKDRIGKVLERDSMSYIKGGKPDLDFFLMIENEKVFLGLRLSKEPLHKRKYKRYTLPASLKANIAFSMLMIAEVKGNETVLDPVCGVGTIPIEAAFIGAKAIGFDKDEEAVKLAKKNAKKSGKEVNFEIKDATKTGLESESVDKIVANLPFGKQIEVKEREEFFNNLLKELFRILKRNGIAVLLTTNPKLIEAIARKTGFKVIETREISLFGLAPQIIKLKKI